MSVGPDMPRDLHDLRAHVAKWGGLNAIDATELIDMLDGLGRAEYAIQGYHEVMREAMPADRMVFVNPEGADWTRIVTPWRPV